MIFYDVHLKRAIIKGEGETQQVEKLLGVGEWAMGNGQYGCLRAF